MDNEVTGTATALEEAAAQSQTETTPANDGTTQGQPEGAPEDSFLSDADLLNQIQQDPRLKKFYGKMQTAYGKSREDLKRGREAAQQIQQFYQDPNYRRQVLQQFAHEVQPPAQRPAGSQVPNTLIEKIKASLAPELQWMAPSLAESQWAVAQEMLAPLQAQQAQQQKQSLESAYDTASRELGSKFPGWESSEEEMGDVYDWLTNKNSQYLHPRYGNRLEALYKLTQLLNGNSGLMRAEAVRASAQAAQSRTVTGQTARPSGEAYTERIKQARTPREAFQVAAQAAQEELRKQGTLPD